MECLIPSHVIPILVAGRVSEVMHLMTCMRHLTREPRKRLRFLILQMPSPDETTKSSEWPRFQSRHVNN